MSLFPHLFAFHRDDGPRRQELCPAHCYEGFSQQPSISAYDLEPEATTQKPWSPEFTSTTNSYTLMGTTGAYSTVGQSVGQCVSPCTPASPTSTTSTTSFFDSNNDLLQLVPNDTDKELLKDYLSNEFMPEVLPESHTDQLEALSNFNTHSLRPSTPSNVSSLAPSPSPAPSSSPSPSPSPSPAPSPVHPSESSPDPEDKHNYLDYLAQYGHLDTQGLWRCHFAGCKRARPFKRRQDFRKHLDGHLGVRRFACPECDARFTDPSARSRHRWSHKAPEQRFKCRPCNIAFASEKTLAKHLSRGKCKVRKRKRRSQQPDLEINMQAS